MSGHPESWDISIPADLCDTPNEFHKVPTGVSLRETNAYINENIAGVCIPISGF